MDPERFPHCRLLGVGRVHLDQLVSQELAAGKPADKAKRAALRAMDRMECQKERCRICVACLISKLLSMTSATDFKPFGGSQCSRRV